MERQKERAGEQVRNDRRALVRETASFSFADRGTLACFVVLRFSTYREA